MRCSVGVHLVVRSRIAKKKTLIHFFSRPYFIKSTTNDDQTRIFNFIKTVEEEYNFEIAENEQNGIGHE